jgi:hypothetical protein
MSVESRQNWTKGMSKLDKIGRFDKCDKGRVQ